LCVGLRGIDGVAARFVLLPLCGEPFSGAWLRAVAFAGRDGHWLIKPKQKNRNAPRGALRLVVQDDARQVGNNRGRCRFGGWRRRRDGT
jgi:hypothetical protein